MGITFVAFTATPKDKTLQLFGTRPDPGRPPADDNLPAPFHVYSMRQAIEEGFILDVLQNYTSYKVAFNLAHEGGAGGRARAGVRSEVERDAAMKGIMGRVRLHEYNIAQRVHIVVEHFRAHVAPLLGGQAKAMVVTASRKEAVRWQLAMRKYIAEHGYHIETLVVFSGEVEDPESAPAPLAAGEGSADAHAGRLELDALVLFKRDLATYVRLYGFLAQIFNYGNTDIEMRAIFFRLQHKLLDFGRESETVDLSSLALTHYTLGNLGTRRLALDTAQGEYKLEPSGPGGGEVRDKQKAALDEIVARVNRLFIGELTEGDKLLYVNDAIKGTLIEQAVNNTREQFGNSPDLDARILDAVMDAFSAFTSMSRQALESERIRAEIKAILLGPGRLYELLWQQRSPGGGNAWGFHAPVRTRKVRAIAQGVMALAWRCPPGVAAAGAVRRPLHQKAQRQPREAGASA